MEITAKNIFQKTEIGHSALLSRDTALPFMLRRTLIIVDGIADVATLHSKAPLYEDLDESLALLIEKGYIVPVEPTVVTKNNPTGATYTDSETISTKQRLLHLIKVDLGSNKEFCSQKNLEKLLSRIDECDNDKAALTAAWSRCIKIINLTIDEKIAATLNESGQQYLHNFSKT